MQQATVRSIHLDAVRSNGYSFQVELSHRIWMQGMRIAEVPIIFTDRFQGSSKMSRKIVWEAFWMVWRLWFQAGLRRSPEVRLRHARAPRRLLEARGSRPSAPCSDP